MPEPVRYARGYDEAYLFMRLRECACGETGFEKDSEIEPVDGGVVERIAGFCPSCGRERRFAFRLPAGLPELHADPRYGEGDEPSRLLDPGEWLVVGDEFAATAELLLAAPRPAPEDVLEARYRLLAALAATGEVAKFVPAGADAVPAGAFWTPLGAELYRDAPDRFGAGALDRELAERRRALAAFEAAHG